MKQTTKSGSTTQKAYPPAPFRSIFALIPNIQASVAELVLQQQKELFEFLAHRCECDLEFVERLRRNEDISRLPALFSKFMQGASRDYVEKARKCVNAGSHASTELADQLKEIQVEVPKVAA